MVRYSAIVVAFIISMLVLVPLAQGAFDAGSTAVAAPANDSYVNGSLPIALAFPDTANITIELSQDDGATYVLINSSDDATSPYVFEWNTASGSFPDGLNRSLRVNITNSSDGLDTVTHYVGNLTLDNAPPIFVLVSPTQGSRYKDGMAVPVNFTVTDATAGIEDGTDCNLWTGADMHPGAVVYSASDGTCNGSLTLGVEYSGYASGNHSWQLSIADRAENWGGGADLGFWIDNEAPAVLDAAANATYVRSDTSIRINATIIDEDGGVVQEANISGIDGSGMQAMAPAAGDEYAITLTPASIGCANGPCQINITTSDDYNNTGSTTALTIIVDDTNPAVTAASTNASIASLAASVRLRLNVTDGNVSSVLAYVASGVVMARIEGDLFEANTTYGALGCAADAACTIYFNATDAAGNRNDSVSLAVTLDSTSPSVTDFVADQAVVHAFATVTFNMTVADANALADVSLIIDGDTTLNPASSLGGTLYQVELSPTAMGCGEGVCALNVSATDVAGNTNDTVSLTITVDSDNPVISSFAANRSYLRSDATLRLYATVTDGNLLNVTVSAGGDAHELSSAGGDLYELNITPAALGCPAGGACTLALTAADAAGNSDSPIPLVVTIDDANPSVTSPATNATTASATASVSISVNATDGNLSSLAASAGTPVALNATGDGLYAVNTSYAALGCGADGPCTVTFTATDGAGNTNSSVTLVVSVDGNESAVNDSANITPTTTPAPSGGGGGGGGGGGTTMVALGSTPISKTVSRSGQLAFTLPGTKSSYGLRIKAIASDSVTLIIQSVELTLQKGESKEVDLNADGTMDVLLALNSFTGTTANLALSTVAQPSVAQPAQTPTLSEARAPPQERVIEPVAMPEGTVPLEAVPEQVAPPQAEQEDEEDAAPQTAPAASSKWWLWALLAAVVSAMAGWLVYRRRERSLERMLTREKELMAQLHATSDGASAGAETGAAATQQAAVPSPAGPASPAAHPHQAHPAAHRAAHHAPHHQAHHKR